MARCAACGSYAGHLVTCPFYQRPITPPPPPSPKDNRK